ncbi:interleukin-5 receptor subunit alpha-like isoform X2 [Dendropsophus ebraccatus]|uniref:interleukin-5 receptor subunit alpha-like isoform X2 n=1 Tax=Dendropsophus ebraccatus TaxID=150705 RepID=UPI003831DEA0
MMAYQGNECVWILLLAFTMVCLQVHATDDKLNFTLKQPNVTVSTFGINSVNVSWKAEEIAEKGNLSVCYNFSYQLGIKKGKWQRLKTNNRTFNLRIHSRLVGSVSNALCESNHIKFQSEPTEFVYNAPQVYINNVSCVLFNITNLNCSWSFRTDAPDDSNYSFALRLKSKWLACEHYLYRHKKKVGCYMRDVFSDNNNKMLLNKIRIGFFSESHNFSKTFRPDAVEILTPPRKIVVVSENENTSIKWFPPASIAIQDGLEDGSTYDYGEDDFVYEIRVIENESKMIFRETNDIKREEQKFTDLAKDKKYYIQIRAKHNNDYSKLWGEWSKPVYINKDLEYDVFPEWILVVIVPTLFAALCFYLCKRYLKILLATQIPHPPQKIKNWLHMDGSNDIRLQANIAIQNEQTVPLTDIEIVTATRDCDEKP